MWGVELKTRKYFISQNKSSQINEVLFYFTGHGLYSENEFYYILSDFEQDKKQLKKYEKIVDDYHKGKLDLSQSKKSLVKSIDVEDDF